MAEQASDEADGYTWNGDLEETDIRSLYAACLSLRFSGHLELRDGANQAQVTFIAGEPIEIEGGDTQRIALWNRGRFRASQLIPSLSGEITDRHELAGSLSEVKPSQLWAWISEYRLSCSIDLERPGQHAHVNFQNGHAESAEVNGMPELAALARVSSWTDGTFQVRLRPLFVSGVLPTGAPLPEGLPPSDPKQFDVSRSIPMDLKQRAAPPPVPRTMPPLPTRGTTPPLGMLADQVAARPNEPPTSDDHPKPFATPRNGDGEEDIAPFPRPGGSATWMAAAVALLLCGGAATLYKLHMPPFSPAPKPIVETPKPKPPVVPTAPMLVEPHAPVAPEPATQPPSGDVAPANGNSVAVSPPVPTEAPPAVEKRPASHDHSADKLVQRGRTLLIEGHAHTALDHFRRAEKLRPGDAALRQYEQQALGKTGRAELDLEGKGTILIDGHRFRSPHKLKIPAGPHSVDFGEGSHDISLRRGEKRHLHARH